MSRFEGGAPSWLFSFVDLTSFLTLVMLAQAHPGQGSAPELGEFAVPRIARDAPADAPSGDAQRWQLRVHPPRAGEEPFELVRDEEPGSERLAADALEGRLEALQHEHAARPLLAPHEDSRSRDLLAAASLLEAYWPGPRLALIDRSPER